MPLIDQTNNRTLPLQVVLANNVLTRMVGLLGKKQPDENTVLHIVPSKSIHSFGMQFPLDIVALNSAGEVIHMIKGLQRNKIANVPRSTRSILEGGAGWIEENKIEMGQRLQTVADQKHTVKIESLRRLFHWPLNICIALLWSQLVLHLFESWQQHHSAITFGLLIHNTLLLILFLLRRESTDTSQKVQDWIVPFATLACAMLLRPVMDAVLWSPYLSLVLQGFGIAAMIISLLSLGRSFGIVPAHRQLQLAGAYRLVRHPLYTSEIIFYLGFFIGNLSYRNGTFILLIIIGQFWRAVAEEKLLQKDEQYQAYLQLVRYRFLPGLY
ncbi:DUF192 domain-containing protein [candidate division KSB1 bacterium]|nr:DUF192 domain-containing protein [candidate division KSB1 bacterium]